MEAVSYIGVGGLVLGGLLYALYCLIRYPASRKGGVPGNPDIGIGRDLHL